MPALRDPPVRPVPPRGPDRGNRRATPAEGRFQTSGASSSRGRRSWSPARPARAPPGPGPVAGCESVPRRIAPRPTSAVPRATSEPAWQDSGWGPGRVTRPVPLPPRWPLDRWFSSTHRCHRPASIPPRPVHGSASRRWPKPHARSTTESGGGSPAPAPCAEGKKDR